MNPRDDLSHLSMTELFRVEAETQLGVLTRGLLEVDRGNAAPAELESLMRAAHSLKGAARIVGLAEIEHIAHAMEDCFVAVQKGELELDHDRIDLLLRGVDLIGLISKSATSVATPEPSTEAQSFVTSVEQLIPREKENGSADDKGKAAEQREPSPVVPAAAVVANDPANSPVERSAIPADAPLEQAIQKQDEQDRFLRLTAENLNRLLALAGESLVESRWLRPFSESMERLRRMHLDLEDVLEAFRVSIQEVPLSEQSHSRLQDVFHRAGESRQYLAERLEELDLFDRRSAHLSNRLYLEVLRARMRPFADGVRQFPRMVRDLARTLGKHVRLEIVGEKTQVDRDILDRLEAPLAHLLRNAIDHGCETPEERAAAGKRPEATIRLEARHSAGALVIIVADDGRGVDVANIRNAVLDRNLSAPELARTMTEAELMEFLFLPGFSMKETVTEISGRGVGLDIVQNLTRSVRGSVRVSTKAGQGTKFQLQLPLTLSVLRTLLVEIGGEPYAIPLAQIANALKFPHDQIEALEGRPHVRYRDHHIGLLRAHQVFESDPPGHNGQDVPVVVLGDRAARYGLVVDRFLGERELVVQPLDPRLGKVKDISAAALMEDGSPVLIVDVDDLLRSIEKLVSGGEFSSFRPQAVEAPKKRKRVLAVDDSLTVRELERKLLVNRGYEADVAVDGMDGWNAVRHGHYDLIITDVDMPRMDGIELTTLIKKDPHLKSLPVLIVSYKDREQDRMRGLEAGADYYLTKGSFHDETLLNAVVDLIGEADGQIAESKKQKAEI